MIDSRAITNRGTETDLEGDGWRAHRSGVVRWSAHWLAHWLARGLGQSARVFLEVAQRRQRRRLAVWDAPLRTQLGQERCANRRQA